MAEDKELTAKQKQEQIDQLNAELAQLRAEVEQRMAEFVAVYDLAAAEFNSKAHELRVLGQKVKPLSYNFVARLVKNWHRRDFMDPVK